MDGEGLQAVAPMAAPARDDDLAVMIAVPTLRRPRELARLLDEQDAAIIDEAVEAARQQAERAALAEQRARAQRRRTNKQPPDSDE